MCHSLLQDPAFFRLLSRIDAELAAEARKGRCPHCAGPLHVADYPRKPRGCPAAVRAEYARRLSFTCGWCETRTTPASVRFLGRRVYVALVLMLVSPQGGFAARAVSDRLAVSTRTLARWRTWWRETFPTTPFWRSARARFLPPVTSDDLPESLWARFGAPTCSERIAQILVFLSPLGSTAMGA